MGPFREKIRVATVFGGVAMSWTNVKAAFARWILFCCFSAVALPPTAPAQTMHYKVDPNWPKELPNNWMMFNAPGIVVDKNDHIWVIQRPRQMPGADAAARGPSPSCSRVLRAAIARKPAQCFASSCLCSSIRKACSRSVM